MFISRLHRHFRHRQYVPPHNNIPPPVGGINLVRT